MHLVCISLEPDFTFQEIIGKEIIERSLDIVDIVDIVASVTSVDSLDRIRSENLSLTLEDGSNANRTQGGFGQIKCGYPLKIWAPWALTPTILLVKSPAPARAIS